MNQSKNQNQVFAAISEPRRREILELLAGHRQMPATAIALKFSISPPAVSQHLQVLRRAGLVNMQKHGQQRLYQINLKNMSAVERWANQLARQWSERFDRLETLLKEEKENMIKRLK